MRKIIINLIGVLIIAGAFITFKKMNTKKEAVKKEAMKVVVSVNSIKVKNTNIPIIINTSGKLSAVNKMDIFAEIQGVFMKTNKPFKAGVKYSKGQSLVKINSNEFRSSLKAKRSNLYNAIASLMPDLKLDYPNSFENWNNYLNNFNVDLTTPTIPMPLSEKENFFISSRKINVQYYEIKNLEERLKKYNIYAPYTGILTKTFVNNGTLVRAGQKLGEFIDPSAYELEVSISESIASNLKIGNKVVVKNLEETKEWQGKIMRINAVLEQTSQTKKIFINLKGKDLSDGVYLKAFIKAKDQDNVFEINRSLLINDKNIYSIENNKLKLISVTPIYFKDKKVIVKGLKDNTVILANTIAGVYEGMEVKIVKE